MGLNYFKSRKRLDFSPHLFDVRNILGLKRGYGNNHFLLKIYGLDKTKFECYYTYRFAAWRRRGFLPQNLLRSRKLKFTKNCHTKH